MIIMQSPHDHASQLALPMFRKVAAEWETPGNVTFAVIDVEEALSYRIDGHGHDMLHWCLPGVPDWLIAVLFRFVLVAE